MLICSDDTELHQDTYTGAISQWLTGTINIFTTTFENEKSMTEAFVFVNKYTYTFIQLYR